MKRSYVVAALLAVLALFALAFVIPVNAAGTAAQIFNGGTGTSTLPAYGQLLIGGKNGEYEYVASSTLTAGATGFSTTSAAYWLTQQSTSNLAEGSNLYFTNGRAVSALTGQNISIFNNNAGYLTSLAGAASSTLLGDSNTFSGLDTFTNGSSNFAGTWQGFAPSHFLTGNQTVTLSGDISGSGATAITTTIGSNKVTLPDIAQVAAHSLLVNNTGSTGNVAAVATSSLGLTTSAFASPNVSQWTNDAGYVTSSFSTTSATYWQSVNNFFSTTSASVFLSLNQGNAFSTTSANWWGSTKGYLTSLAGAASSTILGDNNTFSGNDSFTNASSNFSGTWQTLSPSHFQTALTLPLSIANGGAATTTQVSGGVNYFDGNEITSGTALTFNGTRLGVGSSTPDSEVSILGQTGLALLHVGTSANVGGNRILVDNGWTGAGEYSLLIERNPTTPQFDVDGTGSVGISTSTPGSILSVQGVANFGTATSTFYATGGLNLTAGCFSINGACVGSTSASSTLLSDNNTFSGNTALATTTAWSLNNVIYIDGTHFANNGTGVAAAIALGCSEGEATIVLPPGTTTTSANPGIAPNCANLTIKGAGRDSTVITGSSGHDLFDTEYTGNMHFSLEDLTLDASSTITGISGVQAAFASGNANYVSLSNVHIIGSGNTFTVFFAGPACVEGLIGFILDDLDCTNTFNTITNSVVEGGKAGVDMLSYSLQKDGGITDTIVRYGRAALYENRSDTFVGDTFSGGTDQGVWATGPWMSNTFTGNTMEGMSSDGFRMTCGLGTPCTGNTITANAGINLGGATISIGEFNGSSIGTTTGNVISGNTSFNTAYDIYLAGASDNTVTDNPSASTTVGVYLDSNSNGNTVTLNQAQGDGTPIVDNGNNFDSNNPVVDSFGNAQGNTGNFSLQMQPPQSPSVTSTSTTGGNMANGTYYYVVTALDGAGGETAPSTQIGPVVLGSPSCTNTCSVTIGYGTSAAGAYSFKLYRTTTSGVYGANSLVGTSTNVSMTDTYASPVAGTPPNATTAKYFNITNGAGNTSMWWLPNTTNRSWSGFGIGTSTSLNQAALWVDAFPGPAGAGALRVGDYFTNTGTVLLQVQQRWTGCGANGIAVAGSNGNSPIFSTEGCGQVDVGTTTGYARFTVSGKGSGTGTMVNLVNSASTSVMSVLDNGTTNINGPDSTWPLIISTPLNAQNAQTGLQFRFAGGVSTANIAAINAQLVQSNIPTLSFNLGAGSTAPTPYMTLNPTGLGIGTTTPSAELHVQASGSTVGLRLDVPQNNGYLNAYTNNNQIFGINYKTSGVLELQSYSGVPLVINDQGNNVGIGTSSPGTLVSIGTGSSFVNISPSATSTFANGVNILSGCVSLNSGPCITSGGSSASSTLLSDNNTFSGKLVFANATSTNFFSTTASSTSLYAATSTIGSLNLNTPLPVASGGTGTTTEIANGILYYSNGIITSSPCLTFDGVSNITNGCGSQLWLTNASSTDSNAFDFTNQATGLNILHIGTGGYIGAGTTTPVSNFTEAGNMSVGADSNVAAPPNGLSVEGGYISNASSTVAGNFTVTGTASTTGNAYFGGDVNIATTTATNLLTVAGASNFLSYDGTNLSVAPNGAAVSGGSTAGGVTLIPGVSTGARFNIDGMNSSGVIGLVTNSSANRLFDISNQGTGNSTVVFGDAAGFTAGTGIDNVGIGTTTPWGLLSVIAPVAGSQLPLLNVASSTPTGTTTALIVNASDNVGIGTTIPWSTLSVNGGVDANASSTIGNGTTVGGLTINGGATTTLLSQFQSGYISDASSTVIGQFTATNIINAGNGLTLMTNSQITNTNNPSLPIYDDWGWNATGNSTHPVQINGGSLMVGQTAGFPGGATFATNDILLNGSEGIGTTSPFAELAIQASSGSNYPGNNLFLVSSSTVGATTTLFAVTNNGHINLNTVTYASCTALTTNGSGVLGCTTSDARVKQNIEPISATSSLAGIMRLDPVSFTYNPAAGPVVYKPGLHLGLVAKQVAGVFPNIVSTTSPTALTPDGTLQVDYDQLISPIVASLQQIEHQVQAFAGTGNSSANDINSRIDTEQQEIDAINRRVLRLEEVIAVMGAMMLFGCVGFLVYVIRRRK